MLCLREQLKSQLSHLNDFFCDVKFANIQNLKKHIEIFHEGIKPFNLQIQESYFQESVDPGTARFGNCSFRNP